MKQKVFYYYGLNVYPLRHNRSLVCRVVAREAQQRHAPIRLHIEREEPEFLIDNLRDNITQTLVQPPGLHTLTLTHSHTHTFTHSHSHIHTHTFTLTHSHSHTHTLTHSHSHTHTPLATIAAWFAGLLPARLSSATHPFACTDTERGSFLHTER